MKKLISMVLCMAMMLCMVSTTAFATEAVDTNVDGAVVSENSTSYQDIDVMIASSEDAIVPYANPTNLYYNENVAIIPGGHFAVNVTPTKGRSLRVWLLVKDGSTQMRVSKPAFIGWSIVYNQTFGVGDRDVETVSSCNGNTYQVQFWNKSNDINNISMLIYETGG